MEHKTLQEIEQVAERISFGNALPMTRQDRLEYWAKLLEKQGSQPITALVQLEYLPEQERARVRAENSPLAMAYGDPGLRAAGLGGDTYGDAMKFFEISDREAHYLLCDCHYHGTMTAQTVGTRIRAIMRIGGGATPPAMGQAWNRMWGGY